LYAEFDRDQLLRFLMQAQHYDLELAKRICEQRKLYKELVFILGRMGNAPQALSLIIDELRDVGQAIEFVQGQKDDELWDELLHRSVRDPGLVSQLLEHIAGNIDPIRLIKVYFVITV